MSPNSSIITTRKPKIHFDATQQIVAAIVVLAVFLAQTLPMAASQDGDGNWIEICSEGGAKLIQLDDDDPKQSEGSHCLVCLFSSKELQGVLASHPSILDRKSVV